tara:strand:+ start:44 stop:439 length:396 start_codon:yes stop_codon:yes gene_type:complete
MNLNYKITESEIENNIDVDDLLKDFYVDYDKAPLKKKDNVSDEYNVNNKSEILAMQIDYTTNYTVKMLCNILDYYNISKRKLCKDEMVQLIILYETDDVNICNTETRKRLWNNIKELKSHPYFSRFILLEP